MPVLRLAVVRREMAQAVRLAEAIARARRVSPGELLEVATALGRGQRIPIQRQLLERAYKNRRMPFYLRVPIAEALFDARMAAGAASAAREVLSRAIARAPAGQRRGLLERLVAWGRVQGAVEAVWEELLGTRDPDAAVLAAQLGEELEGPTAALDVLGRAWARFPAHRRLQRVYIKALARQGLRQKLQKVVAKVVSLDPSDPMPWLEVVDAEIMARDRRAARKLIDRLVARYPKDERLIEALIDREQRMPSDPLRLERLFASLLKAGPKSPQHIEAFAEWLLSTRGRAGRKKARVVLRRLLDLPAGRYEGLRRTAAIWQAHGESAAAERILLKLHKDFPKRKGTIRLLALLLAQTGRRGPAMRWWRELIRLSPKPNTTARRLGAEARRSLIVLYGQENKLRVRTAELIASLDEGGGSLGDTLLLFDLLQACEESAVTISLPKGWLDGSHRALRQWGRDPEVRGQRAALLMRHGRREAALQVLLRLNEDDPEGARFALTRLVEVALGAGQAALAARAEAPLLKKPHLSTSLLLKLGELRLRYGDAKGAVTLFRRAAALSPGDTRATARLAQLLRQSGASIEEAVVLRDVVARSVDAEELNGAGQRLLTLAIGDGTCGELLCWLDAITPQHPRRRVLERFRLLAYDAWLRSEELERALGKGGDRAPAPAMLYEALASGDLAVKVRALRQVAGRGTRLPPALARRLMKDSSAVVRRDTALALGASGTAEAASLLVEMDAESTRGVIIAQLLAFGRLPPIPSMQPFLISHLRHNNRTISGLAALALGRSGGREAIEELSTRLRHRRASRLRPAAYVALGALLARHPTKKGWGAAVELLAAGARESLLERVKGAPERLDVFAALWGLAAAGSAQARALLLDRAVSMDNASLRLFALRLLSGPPPRLSPKLWAVEIAWDRVEDLDQRLVRHLLLPWLLPDQAALSEALRTLSPELLPRLHAQLGGSARIERRGRWCRSLGTASIASPELRSFCAL